ncbi:LytR/AlgR family response regulator transcription factor [Marinilabilia salmonicolor]|uniref:LytR/AlgR family response regulator transcription factor n=1 Tax=Marinilabilia salmonicolor TaxID=989 RepID=UPI00029AB92D|nr:LytTR family DNA-binding domain-containing protein [Marinilabilia salmonicolor]
MKVIIIDDEISVRNSITELLKESYPEIRIIASVSSVSEGFSAMHREHPDLLFLDVELPDGLGFELLKKIDPIDFKVIFITGHQEYALNAIKVSALDYILKPFDSDEFCRAMDKACQVIDHEEEQLKILALHENMQNKKVLRRIILPTADNLHVVSISEIIRARADSNYTVFVLSRGGQIMVSRTIKEFDSLLSGSGMIRVHQSHLVNVRYIDKFVKRDGGYLHLKDGSDIPVSQNLKKQVIQAIKDSLYE